MNEEQMIQLAEQIASELPEVTRSEWNKWSQFVERYGLAKATQWAEKLAQDITLRPAVKRANQLIAKAISHQANKVKSLPLSEQKMLFGYVSQVLTIETVRGSLAEPDQTKSRSLRPRRSF